MPVDILRGPCLLEAEGGARQKLGRKHAQRRAPLKLQHAGPTLANRFKHGVVRPFDPWGSPLCTCPSKFIINPYTGCGHACLYCYTTSYIPRAFNPRPKTRLLERLDSDLKSIPEGTLVELSTSTDPYQPLDIDLQLTRRALHRLILSRARVLVTTKSSLVLRDLKLLSKLKPRVAIAITVTSLDPRASSVLEPGAPPPKERLRAVEILTREGIPVVARVDPLIPGVNDRYEDVRRLVTLLSRAGALQITCSTFKARIDSLNRLKKALPLIAGKLERLYRERGERLHGYIYVNRDIRLQYLKMVKEVVEEQGMVFQTCREGFQHLNTPGFACDGSTFTYGIR